MKFSNLLLTAALFLSASVAFADKPVYQGEPFSWDKPENNKVSMTVFVISAGWDFAVYGYDANNNATKLQVIETKDSEHALTLAQIQAKDIPSAFKDSIINSINTEDGYYHAYDLEVEITDESIETIGLMGSNNAKQAKMTVFSPINTNTQNPHIFYALGSSDLLKFGTEGFQDGAVFMVSTGAGTGEGGNFGTPLPTPVVTLLIALGFGAVLVMYRSRKQQAEA